MPENVFDRLARIVIDASAATTAHMLRTGRHRPAVGPGHSVPRHAAPPSAGGGGGGDTDIDPEDPPDPDEVAPLDNPMSALGSLIVGGESGAPEELLAGADGTVLVMVDGTPAWVAEAPATTWSVLSNGDSADPQLVWTDEGDVIMVAGG